MKLLIEVLIILNIMFVMKMIGIFNKKRENGIYVVLASVCVAINLDIRYIQNSITDGSSLHIPLVFLIIITYIIIEHNRKVLFINIDDLMVFSILVLVIFQLTFNTKYNNVKYYTLFLSYASIGIIALLYKSVNKVKFDKIMSAFSYVALYNGILGVLQFITGKKLLYGVMNETIFYAGNGGDVPVKRIVGIAGTNNSGGNLGFLLFAVVLFNYLKNRRKIDFVALIITTIFSALTLTRIGYVAIILTILINFIVSRWNSMNIIFKKVLICNFFVLVSLGIIYYFGDSIYNTLFVQRGSTELARKIQFNYVFEHLIKDNLWLGIGTGQYVDYVYNVFGYKDIDMHSMYINILAENGVIAFLIFVVLNLFIFKKALNKSKSKTEKAFIISLFAGNFICCNFNPSQYYQVNIILYYILIYACVYRNEDTCICRDKRFNLRKKIVNCNFGRRKYV